MPGMPVTMEPITKSRCYKGKDVQDLKTIAPRSPRQEDKCKLQDHGGARDPAHKGRRIGDCK
jgi:hypothetical protein